MIPTRDQHLWERTGPKRILSLDGGGVRGLITLGLLERVESILKSRAADPAAFRLSHYFDLIGGTSTGGIIATLLALGYPVDEIRKIYLDLCPHVFRRPGLLGWITNPKGLVSSVFNANALARQIEQVIDYVTFLSLRGKTELALIEIASIADEKDPNALSESVVKEAVDAAFSEWKQFETQVVNTPIARTPSSHESVVRGRDLFLQSDCKDCHGVLAKGDGASFVNPDIFNEIVFNGNP